MLPRMIGLVGVLALTLAGCGQSEAPHGRWEGYLDSPDWVIAARLQVDSGNVIHATALSVNVADASLPKRVELTRKIKATMPEEWETAPLGRVDFKNNTITKTGGFAPLFVYDPKSRDMTFYFYAGRGKLTEKVRLHPVKEFAEAAP